MLVHQRVQAHQQRTCGSDIQSVDPVELALEIGVGLLPEEHASVSCRIRKQFGEDGLWFPVEVSALYVILEIVISVLLLGSAFGNLQRQPIPEEGVEFVFGTLSEQMFDRAPILVVKLVLPVVRQ